MTNHKITILNSKTGEIVEQKETGKMYDSWIKACGIRDDLKEKYNIIDGVHGEYVVAVEEV